MTIENAGRRFSFKERLHSFKYAIDGLIQLFKTEHNVRIHAVAALIAILAGFVLDIEKWEWVSVLFAIGLVFITELLNTSLEKLADAVCPAVNEKIGVAKDLAAGAVLIASLLALISGCLVFMPKLL